MQAYELAQEAVRTHDKRTAEWLCLYLERRHGLNISSLIGADCMVQSATPLPLLRRVSHG